VGSPCLPPVECSSGTTPSQAAKSRPLRNAAPLPIVAMPGSVSETEQSGSREWYQRLQTPNLWVHRVLFEHFLDSFLYAQLVPIYVAAQCVLGNSPPYQRRFLRYIFVVGNSPT
jgi:hypothetical protein